MSLEVNNFISHDFGTDITTSLIGFGILLKCNKCHSYFYMHSRDYISSEYILSFALEVVERGNINKPGNYFALGGDVGLNCKDLKFKNLLG